MINFLTWLGHAEDVKKQLDGLTTQLDLDKEHAGREDRKTIIMHRLRKAISRRNL